jgi:sugar lactone lactonase YvrE
MKSLLLAICAVLPLGAFSVPAQAQNVTFAGVQTSVAQGTVLGSELCPYSVALDRAGDVFIADYCNDRVLEVPVGGGTPTTLTVSVGGLGLNSPYGVAVDGAGDVFIADNGNNRVVKIPAGGGAQTTVGSGLKFPYGVAVDAAGDVFIADSGNSRVVKVPAGGGAQSTLTVNVSGLGLNGPQSVAVDGAGDVFIADTFNTRVVKVPAGGSAQTIVGSGFSYPTGVSADQAGNVFVADYFNNDVVAVPANGSAQITLASNLNQPGGVAVDAAGDVFIADTYNNRVLEQQDVAVNFGKVNVCPGTQTTPAPCSQTLTLNYNVAATTTFGTTSVVTQGAPNLDFKLSSGGTCTGTVSAGSSCAVNVTFAPLAPGARNGAVRLTDNSGKLLVTTMVRGVGQGPAIAFGPGAQTAVPTTGVSFPFGVAVDGAGDVFIADNNNSVVVEVPAGGGAQITVPASGLLYPRAVAVDGAGDVFIADQGNNRVVEVPAGGGAQTTVGSGLNQPYSLAVDGAGNVIIADTINSRVVEVPAGGGAQITVGSSLNQPYGVAVDGAGNVFISDTVNGRVVEVPADGGAQTTVASGGLSRPYGLAVDAAGDVFVADQALSTVVEIPAGGGAPTTVPAIGLSQPTGVAVDGAGDVFIANHDNGQIVKLRRSQAPMFTFASTPVGSVSSDSPQSVTIQNVGNQPLNAITPGLVVTGSNFLQVAGLGSPADCTSTFSLVPGADCNLSIGFKPTTNGSLNSTATFTDNALNTIPSATQSIALQGIGQQSQTINFTTNAPSTAIYDTGFTVAATGGASGNPVVFSSSGTCSNVGANYTMTSGTGTCSVIANQAGSTYYLPASTVTQSVSATPDSQTITFTQSAPASAPYNGSFKVAATAGSGLAVSFTSSGACGNNGATFTIMSPSGACKVIANQAGSGDYLAAPAVIETTTAVKATPTATLTGAPATGTYLSTFPVTATSNSGLNPTITATGACSISITSPTTGTVTMTSGTGTCTVTAKWAATADYLAETVTKTVAAKKLASTVTWSTPAAITYGTALSPTQLDATASVAGAFVYTPAAGTILKEGNNTLKVTFTPTLSADYTTVTASVVLHVNPAASTITWNAPAAISYGTPLSATQLDAAAFSGANPLPGTYVYSPAAGTVLPAGTHTLSVTFTPTDHTDYAKATAKVTLTVNPAPTTTAITSNLPNPSAVGQPVTVHFTVTQATNYSAPTGSVTVNASTLEHCAAALASGSGSCAVTFNTAGSRTLTATYAGNSNNASSITASPAQQTVN